MLPQAESVRPTHSKAGAAQRRRQILPLAVPRAQSRPLLLVVQRERKSDWIESAPISLLSLSPDLSRKISPRFFGILLCIPADHSICPQSGAIRIRGPHALPPSRDLGSLDFEGVGASPAASNAGTMRWK